MSGAIEQHHRCRLLAGPEAVCAQLSLALVILAALLLRRERERGPSRRERTVFAFDVSKQFVSSGAAHLSGLAFSVAAAAAAAGSSSRLSGRQQQQEQPSECGWYLVLFSVDTVAGSALAILFHRAAVAAAVKLVEREREKKSAETTTEEQPFSSSRNLAAAIARCGDYGSPPTLRLFLPQLAEWTCAVVAARLCCGFSVLSLRSFFSAVGAGVDRIFSSSSSSLSNSLELFSVMLVGPLLMNAGQALVQDGMLKAKEKKEMKRAAAVGTAGAAGAEEANSGSEGEELLPSPPGSASSAFCPISRHP